MKNLIILMVALFALLAFAADSEAACGRGLFGIRARRSQGRGLFQGNGPVRRGFGGGSCGRGGCG